MTSYEIRKKLEAIESSMDFLRTMLKREKREMSRRVGELEWFVDHNVNHIYDESVKRHILCIKSHKSLIDSIEYKLAEREDIRNELLNAFESARKDEEGCRVRDAFDIEYIIIKNGFINGTKL